MSDSGAAAEAREWLDDAESELDDALYMYDDGRLDSAAFHFHQAIEKALKALAIHRTGDYPRTHDLVELADAETR
ncbi:MAG: HEPN domain-containing protein, partial [Candidatus Nanohaloarchaea archaeon]